MARIRTIKPEFQQSQSIGFISREARLTFILLWPQCDDSGRVRANSRMLASVLYPYDNDAPEKMEGWLTELEAAGCIRLYSIDGKEYLDIPKWQQHQKVDHPQQSKYPPFREDSRILANNRERSGVDQGPRTKEGIKDISNTESVSNIPHAKENFANGQMLKFDKEFNLEFWPLYPIKNDKRNALIAFRKAREKTELVSIMDGLNRYIEFLKQPNAPQPKYAQGWLNGERWKDENIPHVNANGHGNGNGNATGPITALHRAGEKVLAVRAERRRREAEISGDVAKPLLVGK